MNPDLRSERPVTNCLSHGMALSPMLRGYLKDSTVLKTASTSGLFQTQIYTPQDMGNNHTRQSCAADEAQCHWGSWCTTDQKMATVHETLSMKQPRNSHCSTCYISRPMKVCIKGQRHKLGPLERSRLAQHMYEEGNQVCWKESRLLKIESNNTCTKYKELAHISVG
jgi:hypothetical protein